MTLAELARALVNEARLAHQRRLLVLAGSRDFGFSAAQQVIDVGRFDEVLWITKASPAGGRVLHGSHAHHLLGSEVDALLFDIYSGLDVEALGAASGAIRAGGLLVLIAPPRHRWKEFFDPEQARIAVHPVAPEAVTRRFMQRFERETNSASVVWVEEGEPILSLPQVAPTPVSPLTPDEQGCITQDQHRAVMAIIETRQANTPLVLTSDRGRGKSAALGLAAAALLRQGMERIVVTAPRFDSAATIFFHAQQHLPAAQRSRDLVTFRDARLQFVAPDALASIEPPQLLLVDEAAAIPAHLLEKMVVTNRPVVFATTVHGYEGSGRGFATRFQTLLDARTPGWRAMELKQPVRWAEGDPLEQWIFRALLLDGTPAENGVAATSLRATCVYERVDRDQLVNDERLLAELFGLLVLAHYRTTPLDLRFLLDGPNLSMWIARQGEHVIGAALVAEEGGFEPSLARDVWEGRRRPRGHLLAQSLAVHAGFEEAPMMRFHRVVRIAIHPAAQGRGIGSALLDAITANAQVACADGVGSSFGASAELMRFWQRAGFRPVRLGVTKEAASGAPAIMVLRALSAKGAALYSEARARFLDALPHLLADPLRDLEPALGALLSQRTSDDPPPLCHLTPRDWQELAAYAIGRREVELVLGPVMRLIGSVSLAAISPDSRHLIDAKLSAHKAWPEIVSEFGFRGRAEATQALRSALREMVIASGGASVRKAIDEIERSNEQEIESGSKSNR